MSSLSKRGFPLILILFFGLQLSVLAQDLKDQVSWLGSYHHSKDELLGKEYVFPESIDNFFVDTFHSTFTVVYALPEEKGDDPMNKVSCYDLQRLDLLWEMDFPRRGRRMEFGHGYVSYKYENQVTILNPRSGEFAGRHKGNVLAYFPMNNSLITYHLDVYQKGGYLVSNNLDSGSVNWHYRIGDWEKFIPARIFGDTMMAIRELPYEMVNLISGEKKEYIPKGFYTNEDENSMFRITAPEGSDYFVQALDAKLIKFRWKDLSIVWHMGLPVRKTRDMEMHIEDTVLHLVNFGRTTNSVGSMIISGKPYMAAINWNTKEPYYSKVVDPYSEWIIDAKWENGKTYITRKGNYQVYSSLSGELLKEVAPDIPAIYRKGLFWAEKDFSIITENDFMVHSKVLAPNSGYILSYIESDNLVPSAVIGEQMFDQIGASPGYGIIREEDQNNYDFIQIIPLDNQTDSVGFLPDGLDQVFAHELRVPASLNEHGYLISRNDGIYLFDRGGKIIANLHFNSEPEGWGQILQVFGNILFFRDGKQIKVFDLKTLK